VQDAIDAIGNIRILESLVGTDDKVTGNLPLVVHYAYKLGRAVERARVRPFEPFALIGRKVTIGGSEGAKTTNQGTAEIYAELKAKYQPEVEAIMHSQDISYTQATDQLGDSLGVTGRHIRDYTKNPAPKNGSRHRGKSAPRRS
jgi:hypothetical protein